MAASVPTRAEGVDVLKLPLNPLEGFVLSRVDGQSTAEDIAIMCGVPHDQATAILGRLAELGAVVLPGHKPTAAARVVTSANSSSAAPPRATATSSATNNREVPLIERLYGEGAQAPDFDVSELDAEADLEPGPRRRIVVAYHLTQSGTFYEQLGVSETADKAEIRAAYFELSKAFHPDAYFGRELGPYREKTEAVFQRLTEAYETLSRKKRRTEYDAFLAATKRIERAEQLARDVEGEADQSLADTQDAAIAAPSQPVDVRPRKSIDERRAVAAERMRQRFASMSSMRPPRISNSPGRTERVSTPADRQKARESALDGLRRVLKSSASRAPVQLAGLVEDAKAAEQAGDLATAMSCVRHVLLLDANHERALEIHKRIAPVYEEQLVADHVAQATFHEKNGRWRLAAKSWRIVADRRPQDVVAARQAALALLHCNEDLHQARTYAETAVRLQGNDLANLTALARVYLAAGLKLNARRELEKAIKLSPRDATLKKLFAECSS